MSMHLGNDSAVEGVCLEDIRAGLQIFHVNVVDDIGSRDNQDIIVALHVATMFLVLLASKVLFLRSPRYTCSYWCMPAFLDNHTTVTSNNDQGTLQPVGTVTT